MGDVGEVDLGGQVMPQGRAQALILGERAARECPLALERRFGPPPEQNVQTAVPDLKDDGQHLVGELRGWYSRSRLPVLLRPLAVPGEGGVWLLAVPGGGGACGLLDLPRAGGLRLLALSGRRELRLVV